MHLQIISSICTNLPDNLEHTRVTTEMYLIRLEPKHSACPRKAPDRVSHHLYLINHGDFVELLRGQHFNSTGDMVGERHLLNLLAGAEAAVNTEGIDLVEYLHGEEPERAAVDTGLGGSKAGERVVRLAAVRGAAVVHHPPAHGAREGVPCVRRREVGSGHDRLVLPQLLREVGDTELGEGREEERVRVLGREG
uniref:Uncharacterized protein n=1 Tax=Arundo donax TaxID=35708 RepID=A0A0A9G0W7_ARUDO